MGVVKYLEFVIGDNYVREIFNVVVLVSIMDWMELFIFYFDFDKEGFILFYWVVKFNYILFLEVFVDFIDVNVKDKDL